MVIKKLIKIYINNKNNLNECIDIFKDHPSYFSIKHICK